MYLFWIAVALIGIFRVNSGANGGVGATQSFLQDGYVKDLVKSEVVTEMRKVRHGNQQLKRAFRGLLRSLGQLTEEQDSYREGFLKQQKEIRNLKHELDVIKAEMTTVKSTLNSTRGELTSTQTKLAQVNSFLITKNQELNSTIIELQSAEFQLKSGMVCNQELLRLKDFDDKAVHDFPLVTHGGLQELVMCTRICRDDTRCKSYRFNKETGNCTTYGVGYSVPGNTLETVTVESGSQLYLMCERTDSFGTTCNSSSDCNYCNSYCNNGKCDCAVGYSYNATLGKCVKSCTRYGDFFSMYRNYGIYGCNTDKIWASSGTQCMDACRKKTSFMCVNAEIKVANGVCHMCKRTWFSLSPSKWDTTAKGWNFYYRHCATDDNED